MRILFLILFYTIYTFASVGTVVDVVGKATLSRGSKTLTISKKLSINEHDIIKTGANAKVKIFFKDHTAVSLGQNTTFDIARYYFNGKKNSQIKFKVLKGFFKTVTGQIGKIAPNRFKLQTKNATIGIRGTVFAGKVTDSNEVVICTDGKIILFTSNGDVEIDAGRRGLLRGRGKVSVKSYSEAEKKQLIEKSGWYGSMSTQELIEYIKRNFKEPLRSQLLATIYNILQKDSDEKQDFGKKVVNADDIGYIDDITINGREFDSLDNRDIEFYRDDLENGQVIVQGLLESDDKNTPVDNLFVEISTDGGDTWSRAKGHSEWDWRFEPELGKTYHFSVRVVKEEPASGNSTMFAENEEEDTSQSQAQNNATDTNQTTPSGLPHTLTIAGFTLTLGNNVTLTGGKLSGLGTITIPYIAQISSLSTNNIPVTFSNLSYSNGTVTVGDITYNQPFTISTPLLDLHINSITFSPTPANNAINGNITFNSAIFQTLNNESIPLNSRLFPDHFSLDLPFNGRSINIWEEKSVSLDITSGSINISYTPGDTLPKVSFHLPNAQLNFGDLLKDTNGVSFKTAINDLENINITLPKALSLFDTGLKLPSGFHIGGNFSDLANPVINLSGDIDLSSYQNDIINGITGATLSATVQKTGFDGSVTLNGALNPITIINRGSEQKNVKLVFDGNNPNLSISFHNGDMHPHISYSGITPKIYFGDLLKDASNGASNLFATISDLEHPSINISNALSLLNSKIRLPHGLSASVDLSDMHNPVITFSVGIDFSQYNNIVAKKLQNAQISGTISKNGLIADITAAKPADIDIYPQKNVKIVFQGSSGPTLHVEIKGATSLPELHISNIDAKLDFGDLLKDVTNPANNVLADISALADETSSLEINLPAKVRLLNSKVLLSSSLVNLNLQDKSISLSSSLDLHEYNSNPIISAIDGSTISATINSSGFEGSISVVGGIAPIDIWAEHGVRMSINGNPSVTLRIGSGGVKFDFGSLNASIDFGDLLKTAQNAGHYIASLQNAASQNGEYHITFSNKLYLLDSKFGIENGSISINPTAKSISIGATARLNEYSSPIIKAFDNSTFNASLSTAGFEGNITKNGGFSPIVLLDRGGAGKDISLEFTSSPTISFSVLNSGVHFGIDGGGANINFGEFLGGATASLSSLQHGVYSWGVSGRHKLFSSAKAYVENITNAELDISDIKDPKISFSGQVDLSEYGGFFSTMTGVALEDVMISKSGFQATITPQLNDLNIWQEKHVALHFTQNPSISLKLQGSNFKMGFKTLKAEVHFGDLLNNAVASIDDLVQNGQTVKDTYSWRIDQADIPLMDSGITLNSLSGTLNLADLTDPTITLNATADLSHFSEVFKFVNSASLENVTISKHEFSGNLNLTMQDIDIWKDKNVKLHFTQNPSFYLRINSSGVKVGANSVQANVNFGNLLNNSVADIHSLGNDVYSFSVSGENNLAGTPVNISNLNGQVDLSNLKNPVITLNATASIPSMGSKFQGIALQNATISKTGFDGDIQVLLGNINLYSEDSKKIDLEFVNNSPATLHLTLTREKFDIGVTDLNAELAFTNMLNNQKIPLVPLLENGVRVPRTFSWNVAGPINFVNDSKGIIPVTNMKGKIDLSSWSDPKVGFGATANFTNYNLSNNINLGIVEVTNAEITRHSIKWNLAITNASANFTILDLGPNDSDDVRVELSNINGSLGNSGGSLNGADGTLFFGKLFDGNKQASLSYQTGENGLKTYTFSLDDELIYRKDENNFIRFNGISGQLIETSKDHYKVKFSSQAIIKSSVLQAINIEQISAENLDISNSGFKGDITASWTNNTISLLQGKVALELSNLGVHIDSSKTMPISLNQFGGKLDIQNLFDQSQAKASISFDQNTKQIKWGFPQNQTLSISQNFQFIGLSGSINVDSIHNLAIAFSGKFGYKGINAQLNLQDFTISHNGLHGTVALTSALTIYNKLKLSKFSVAFAGSDTSGSAELTYADTSFLGSGKPMDVALGATVDRTGIKDFSIKGNVPGVNIPNFANITFTSLSTSPSFSNFWVKMSGNIKPTNPLFSAASNVEFQNLKISHSGISVDSAGVMFDTSGANASLGGLSMHLDKLGIGFENNLFYIKAQGGLSLEVVSADGGVTLYSDKHIHVENISVDIHQSGLIAKGSLTWYDKDAVYGNGFHATLNMNIAQLITASGEFRIGHKDAIFYWMASLSGGVAGGIPLSPIPLSIYEVGGGIAYHMIFDESKKDFVPHGGAFSLMLSTYMGTSSDNGYMWNGQIKITAGFTNGNLQNLILQGDSWIMANLHASPAKRKISAMMVFSTSPKAFHVTATANVEYHKVTVKGSLDAMLSSSDKHIFIGTDEDYAWAFHIDKQLGYVSVGIFGYEGYGFFMANTSALAIGNGVKFEKTWKKDWVGPDPKLEIKFNAMIKALVIYRPTFQLYADAFAELNLKACYGYCLNIGADVQAKLATPNPNYLWAKATFHAFSHSFSFSGYIYGSGDLQEAQEYTPKILDRIEPASPTIGILPVFKVYTTFVHDQPVNIAFSSVHLRKRVGNSWEYVPFDLTGLEGDVIGTTIIPKQPLLKNTSYAIDGIINFTYTQNGKTETKSENFNMSYTTRNSDKIDFDTMVSYVKPADHQENVSEDTRVEIKYNKQIIQRLGGFNNQYLDRYRVVLFDSDNHLIIGHFTTPDTSTYEAVFVPSKPLRVYRYCVNQQGEIRETFIVNNNFVNPFNNYKVDDGVDLNQKMGIHTAPAPSGVTGTIPSANPLSNYANTQNSNSNSNGGSGFNTVQVSNAAVSTQVAQIIIPSYIRKGPITLHSPEALGDLVLTSWNNGKMYKYYRANEYKVQIRYYPPGNQQPQIVRSYKFKVKYNNAIKEAKRKITQMHDNLDPKLTVSLDKHRVGGKEASSSYTTQICGGNYNGGFYNEVRVRIDDSLLDIGITTGIKTKVIATWTYQKKDGSQEKIKKIIHDGDRFLLPGILESYSAIIEYHLETTNELLYKTDMSLVSGDPFDACMEEQMQEAEEKVGEKVQNGSQNAHNPMNNFGSGSPDGGFGPGGLPMGGSILDQSGTFTGNFNQGI